MLRITFFRPSVSRRYYEQSESYTVVEINDYAVGKEPGVYCKYRDNLGRIQTVRLSTCGVPSGGWEFNGEGREFLPKRKQYQMDVVYSSFVFCKYVSREMWEINKEKAKRFAPILTA